MDGVTVYFNPSCSKCRASRELLEERGVQANYLRYLDEAPSRKDLEHVMLLLGIDNPKAMMRTGEAVYGELGLAAVTTTEELLDAMVANPILIERPIVILADPPLIPPPPKPLPELLT